MNPEPITSLTPPDNGWLGGLRRSTAAERAEEIDADDACDDDMTADEWAAWVAAEVADQAWLASLPPAAAKAERHARHLISPFRRLIDGLRVQVAVAQIERARAKRIVQLGLLAVLLAAVVAVLAVLVAAIAVAMAIRRAARPAPVAAIRGRALPAITLCSRLLPVPLAARG